MVTKQDLVQMFLDAGDDEEAIQALLSGAGKSTRQAALTAAMMIRKSELLRVLGSVETARAELDELRDRITAVQGVRQRAEEAAEEAVRKLEQLKAEAAARAEPLALLADLEGRGMGAAELARLVDILGRIAADQGALPEEGVATFFEFVERFGNVLSLDLETRRAEARSATAKAEAERLEAELSAAEAACRERREVIDAVQDLTRRGAKRQDLINWPVILDRAGLTPLLLGEALQEFTDIEVLLARRREEVVALSEQQATLTAAIAALKQERGRYEAELDAVKQQTLRALSEAFAHVQELTEVANVEMGRTARLIGSNVGTLDAVIKELAAVEERRGRSGRNLDFSNAIFELNDQSIAFWKAASWPLMEGFLRGARIWIDTSGQDVPCTPPESLVGPGRVSRYGKLRPSELLLWLASCIDPLHQGVGRP